MFNESFVKKQNNLIESYKAIRFFGLFLAFLCCFVSGLSSGGFDNPTQDSPVGQSLFLCAISLLLLQALARYIIRYRLRSQLWEGYLKASGDKVLDLDKRDYSAKVGPVVSNGTSSISLLRASKGKQFGYDTTFQTVRAYHSKKFLTKDDLSFDVELLVLAVDLKQKVPHIFIDGKSQNRKTRHNKNLWFLASKLTKDQKIQALEGDFNKYFEIYTPAKTANNDYAREIDILSIMSPDAMLALRNEGYDFDYEFHGQHLYIIHEPDILTTDGFEAYILALEAALTELLPQIKGHRHMIDGAELKTHVSRFNTNDTVSLWANIFVYTAAGFAFLMLGGFIASL